MCGLMNPKVFIGSVTKAWGCDEEQIDISSVCYTSDGETGSTQSVYIGKVRGSRTSDAEFPYAIFDPIFSPSIPGTVWVDGLLVWDDLNNELTTIGRKIGVVQDTPFKTGETGCLLVECVVVRLLNNEIKELFDSIWRTEISKWRLIDMSKGVSYTNWDGVLIQGGVRDGFWMGDSRYCSLR
jgi:hypothetical protein